MTRPLMLLLLAFACASAAEARQVSLSIGGGYVPDERSFAATTTFTEYFEPGVADTTYDIANGGLVDVAASIAVADRFTVFSGASVVLRSADVRTVAQVPHPFFFGQARGAEHALDDETRREVIVRAELGWSPVAVGRVRMTLSGGPAAVHVSQTFVNALGIREAGYPFADVELVPELVTRSAWGLGGTAALTATWLATDNVGLGLSARYTRADFRINDVEVRAGGPSVIGSLTLRLR